MAWFPCNIGGGGSSEIANILKGTSDPSSSIGDNGQLYLKYYDYSNDYSFREYLEVTSSGPYINTEVNCTSNAYFEVDFNFTGSHSESRVFGCGHGGGAMFLIQNYNFDYISAGEGSSSNTYQIPDANNRHKYKANADGIYVDDVLVDTNVHWDNALPQRHYNLFAIDWDGTAYYATNTRVYSCRIWNGTNIVRYLLPALRKSDDVVGMFDIVNGIFYTNSGSGSFTISSTETNIGNTIIDSFAKVNDAWQNLIGTNIDDIDYVNNPPKTISYLKWQITKTRSVPNNGFLQVAEFYLYQNAEKYTWDSNASISTDMAGPTGYEIAKLIDGNYNTKYATGQWGNVQTNECNIVISLGETITLTNTSSYCFVTANDEITRDPVSWKLYGSADGTNWELLDERTDADIPTDRGRQTVNYPFNIGGGSPVVPFEKEILHSIVQDQSGSSVPVSVTFTEDYQIAFICGLIADNVGTGAISVNALGGASELYGEYWERYVSAGIAIQLPSNKTITGYFPYSDGGAYYDIFGAIGMSRLPSEYEVQATIYTSNISIGLSKVYDHIVVFVGMDSSDSNSITLAMNETSIPLTVENEKFSRYSYHASQEITSDSATLNFTYSGGTVTDSTIVVFAYNE